MPRIHQLDAGVVNKIAAGEVIERPASVVKELLENSIDALATRVDVDITQGGADQIRVVDDGKGIHPDDFLLAVHSHATSKINSADDLFRVNTMGFRGEALASISEVSRLRIRSRQDANTGVELEVNCGYIEQPQLCGCPAGTLVEVSQLFVNTPVRRKFLKTTATEFGHISEQFTRIALAHPRTHMVLRHNEKIIYELPRTNQLVDRLRLSYGSELDDKLIWVESEANDIRIWGYVAHPSHSKSTRKGQYLYLNGRCIQDRSLGHALSEAYRGLLMVGRQPIAFLFLEMPASLVDVNVHPTKVEVRFRDSQQIYRQLLSTIRTKFLSADLESDLRVLHAADMPPKRVPQTEHQRELKIELADWASQKSCPAKTVLLTSDGAVKSQSEGANLLSGAWLPADIGSTLAPSELSDTNVSVEAEAGFVSSRTSVKPTIRAIQIHDRYLVTETENGLAVIDQHALHERVMYEYLRQRVLAGSIESQQMLVPETIEVSHKEASLLLEHVALLAQLGIGIEEFGKNTILLNRYPVMLVNANWPQIVRDIAEQIDSREKKPNRRDILDKLLHIMSCTAAVKAGQRLKPEEIESLLAQRHLIDDAHHCPHGRPTALVLSQSELDRQFGRLG